jgi:hypothetical protein
VKPDYTRIGRVRHARPWDEPPDDPWSDVTACFWAVVFLLAIFLLSSWLPGVR